MSEKIYAGMDLGQRFHQVAVVSANRKELVAPFRVGRGRRGIQEFLDGLRFLTRDPEQVVVTVEATGNYWNELIWDLSARGCEVYLAHPKKAHDLRRFFALHTKTDITDAEASPSVVLQATYYTSRSPPPAISSPHSITD
jgi:transposase